ncbi:MAG TPA: hypothetical protein VHY58_09885 [Streptosporangiaceae bacterium]|jgi:hypothetical protein|nr:hypothetical protein [Streptosporangiaceae bacterium]
MSPDLAPLAAAVPGLTRSDPRAPGISREHRPGGFGYRDPSGADVTDAETLGRIRALAIPPAWTEVWISADPLGHIQATGIDGRAGPSTATTSSGASSATSRSSRTCCGSPRPCPRCGRLPSTT